MGAPFGEYLRAFDSRLMITWLMRSTSTSASTGSPRLSNVRVGPTPAVYSSIKWRHNSTKSQRLRCRTNMLVSMSEVSNKSFTRTSIRRIERSISSRPWHITSAEAARSTCLRRSCAFPFKLVSGVLSSWETIQSNLLLDYPPPQLARLNGSLQSGHEIITFDRLLDKIVCAAPQGLDGKIVLAMASNQ